LPPLAEELGRLLGTREDAAALVYARRVLEVVVADVCQKALRRDRGTEPLERLLDTLGRERVVPPEKEHVLISMRNVNQLGKLGAHPKAFTLNHVREAFLALAPVLDWYGAWWDAAGPGDGQARLSCSSSARSSASDIMPTCWATTLPSLKMNRAGMAEMP
jgi:hypothetical protein